MVFPALMSDKVVPLTKSLGIDEQFREVIENETTGILLGNTCDQRYEAAKAVQARKVSLMGK